MIEPVISYLLGNCSCSTETQYLAFDSDRCYWLTHKRIHDEAEASWKGIWLPLAACPHIRPGPCAIQVVPSAIESSFCRSAASRHHNWESLAAVHCYSQKRCDTAPDWCRPPHPISHPTSAPPGACPQPRTGPSATQVVPLSRSNVECKKRTLNIRW